MIAKSIVYDALVSVIQKFKIYFSKKSITISGCLVIPLLLLIAVHQYITTGIIVLVSTCYSFFVVIILVNEFYRRIISCQSAFHNMQLAATRNLAKEVGVETIYRQIEALMSLFVALRPEKPFPDSNDYAAAPDVLNMLARTIFIAQPNLIIETGSGLSTLVMAYCLKRTGKGKLISLEHDMSYAEVSRNILKLHGLESYAEVLYAPLVEHQIHGEKWHWYDCSKITMDRPVDIFFIDGPVQKNIPCARYPAIPLMVSHLSPVAIVLLDDAKRQDETNIVNRWRHEYPKLQATYLDFKKGAYLLKFNRSGTV